MVISSVMARENEAREESFGHHLQLKRLIDPINSEDVLGTSTLKHDRCKIFFFALKQRFGTSMRRIFQQLSIEIESNISKPEPIRFILRRQAEYSFNAPIFTDLRDGRDSHISLRSRRMNECVTFLRNRSWLSFRRFESEVRASHVPDALLRQTGLVQCSNCHRRPQRNRVRGKDMMAAKSGGNLLVCRLVESSTAPFRSLGSLSVPATLMPSEISTRQFQVRPNPALRLRRYGFTAPRALVKLALAK
jgi:hypothetical protein